MKNQRLKGCLLQMGMLITILIFIPLLLRVGYCQRWWGKENLLFRSMWLCTCSEEFEQSLYPENVTVLASACDCSEGRYRGSARPRFFLTPFPAVLFQTCEASPIAARVPGNQFLQVGNHLIDLYTGETTPFVPPSGTGISPETWVTEDLLWVLNRGEYYLYRLSDQASLLIPDFRDLERGQVDISVLIEKLKQADQVWVIEYTVGTDLIALHTDFWNHPDENFYFNFLSLPREIYKKGVDQFLADNGIAYEYVGNKNTTTSPTGRFIAERDGVYVVENNEKIFDYEIPLPHFYPYGVYSFPYSPTFFYPLLWRGDERAVVLTISPIIGDLDSTTEPPHIPLFATFPSSAAGPFGILFSLPQPVLMVTIPQDVLEEVPREMP